MSYRIGIDIGGTKILYGLVDNNANIILKKKIKTPSTAKPERAIEFICDGLLEFLSEANCTLDDISFIGAGVPGTVDTNRGYVLYCPNINWTDVDAGEIFKEKLGRDVLLAQDSRLAALGENLFGAGQNCSNLACITLGTGIGCGIMLNGKIFGGQMGCAGELGHTVVERSGRMCSCGKKGCLERYSSGTGLKISAMEKLPELFDESSSTEQLFELAYDGNETALDIIDEGVDILAASIANLVGITSVDLIILSGGMCEHEKLILEPLASKVYAYGYPSWNRKPTLKIVKAQLGSDAPMIGAAFLDTQL